MIKCKNLTCIYKNTNKGVSNISLEINGGEMIAVVGRNGAGKSTLLNMLMGTIVPTEGEILCDEMLTYHDIGMCTQKQSIDWYLSVKDNILLGAYLAGMKWREAESETQKAMKIMDLQEYARKSPDSLSGGQQQRLQVARALVHSPKLMILDEPTAGMDYVYSKRLFEYLLHEKEYGKTILISSHDLVMLEDYCDKLLFLEAGRQIFYGNMYDFLQNDKINKVVNIKYIGSLSQKSVEKFKFLKFEVDDNCIRVPEENLEALGDVIQLIMETAQISGIDVEKNGLKDYI